MFFPSLKDHRSALPFDLCLKRITSSILFSISCFPKDKPGGSYSIVTACRRLLRVAQSNRNGKQATYNFELSSSHLGKSKNEQVQLYE